MVGAQDSEAATEAAERVTAPLLSFVQALVKLESSVEVTKKSLVVALASASLFENSPSDVSFQNHAYGHAVGERGN